MMNNLFRLAGAASRRRFTGRSRSMAGAAAASLLLASSAWSQTTPTPPTSVAPVIPPPDMPTPARNPAAPVSAATIRAETNKDIARRQAAIAQAGITSHTAEILELNGDLKGARTKFREALDTPDFNSRNSPGAYNQALQGLRRVDLQLIAKAEANGDTKLFKELLDELLKYLPNDEATLQWKKFYEDALAGKNERTFITNPATNPQFLSDEKMVERMFIEAEQFRRTGQYDSADLRFKEILKIDPYNEAARRGMMKVTSEKQAYAEKAQAYTRQKRLTETGQAWAQTYVRNVFGDPGNGAVQPFQRRTDFAVANKLKTIILPRVSFEGSSLRDAAAALVSLSKQYDQPDHTGVNFVVQPEAARAAADRPITLSLHNVPLGEALRYVLTLAGVKSKVEEFAVFIVSLKDTGQVLLRRTFPVQPDFFTVTAAPDTGGGGGAAGGGRPPPVVSAGPTTGAGASGDVRAELEKRGVSFTAPGASAVYLPSQGLLQMYNTQDQLDFLEELLSSSSTRTYMVDVATKIVQISQEDLNDLTFNYGLNLIPASPLFNPTAPGVGSSPSVATALRGSQAFSISNLDALLRGTGAVVPNSVRLTGSLNGLTYAAVLTALQQKRSFDLLAQPSVRVRTGESATFNATRTFFYPTDFDPPESVSIQANTGGGNNNNNNNTVLAGPPTVIPTFPNNFATQDIGVLLKVQPQVSADARTIDLSLFPEVVDFEGFINYGDPIFVVDTNNQQLLMTPNQIPQPVFNRRRVTTRVTVRDGYTVVLGGLMREDVEEINDKIPFFGDIPIAGRLFRSKATRAVKTNLLIFVTTRIYLNSGELLNPPETSNVVPIQTLPADDYVAPPPLIQTSMPQQYADKDMKDMH